MYATTFSNNSVLRVDISKLELTSEWLSNHGVKFEITRYYGSTHSFARFDFIEAPQSVIDAHNTKFNPQLVVEDYCEDFHSVEYISCNPELFAQISEVLSQVSRELVEEVAIAFEIDNDLSFNDIVESFVSIALDYYFDCPQGLIQAIHNRIYRILSKLFTISSNAS